MVFVGGERRACFLLVYVTLFNLDRQNLLLPKDIYQAKTIKQNGTVESTYHYNTKAVIIIMPIMHSAMLAALGLDQGLITFAPQMDHSGVYW